MAVRAPNRSARSLCHIPTLSDLIFAAQSLATRDGIGYVIADVEGKATGSLRADLEKVAGTIWTRIIE